jgi:hypothetical protein
MKSKNIRAFKILLERKIKRSYRKYKQKPYDLKRESEVIGKIFGTRVYECNFKGTAS